jgi:hypothetical protein
MRCFRTSKVLLLALWLGLAFGSYSFGQATCQNGCKTAYGYGKPGPNTFCIFHTDFGFKTVGYALPTAIDTPVAESFPTALTGNIVVFWLCDCSATCPTPNLQEAALPTFVGIIFVFFQTHCTAGP